MHSKIRTAGVIATYNQEGFVAEAVLSLAEQVDEVVVVDDCSTDRTQEVLRDLKVPNLKLLFHGKNQGVSSSYNEAVAVAEADVVFIQGGDDRSLPGRVQDQLSLLSKPGAVLCFGKPLVIDSNGDSLPNDAAPEFFQLVEDPKILEYLYFVGNFVCAPSVSMRKVDYEAMGGFNPSIAYLQDFELWLKLAGVGRFEQSEKPLVEYRKHAKNLSRDSIAKSVGYAARYEAEMDFVLGSSANHFNHSALCDLGRHVGLSQRVLDEIDERLLLALIQLSHSNVTQVRRGLSLLLELIGEKGNLDFLTEYGIDNAKLDEYSQLCDHKNSSAIARVDFQIRKTLSDSNSSVRGDS